MVFGRVLDHQVGQERDERNRLYGVRRLIAEDLRDRSKFHLRGPALLDQESTGHCGGFAAANEAQSSPFRVKGVDNEYAHGFYYEIKRRRWDGFGLEDGTTTQAVMRLYVARGLGRSYAWGFDIADVRRQLEFGPVLCGTSWTTDMFVPDSDGIIHPTGSDQGGHLWLADGWYRNFRGRSGRTYGRCLRLLNSWGTWGILGRAVIPEQEAQHVIFGLNGECGVPVTRTFPSSTTGT